MANQKASSIKKSRPLTIKQKKFIKAKLEGKTGVAAAQEAYGVDYKLGTVMATENLAKPSIAAALEEAYAKQGLTMEAIVQPIADGIRSNRVVQIEGDFYQTDVPDMPTRIRAAGLAALWIGIGKQNDMPSGGIHFHNHTDGTRSEYGI